MILLSRNSMKNCLILPTFIERADGDTEEDNVHNLNDHDEELKVNKLWSSKVVLMKRGPYCTKKAGVYPHIWIVNKIFCFSTSSCINNCCYNHNKQRHSLCIHNIFPELLVFHFL